MSEATAVAAALSSPGPGTPYDEAWLKAWESAYVGQQAWLGPVRLATAGPDESRLITGWARQRVGPIAITALAGWYWPARGVGVLGAGHREDVFTHLAAELERSLRWPVFRLGPVASDDQATHRLLRSLRARGFSVWQRELGAVMRLPLPAAGGEIASFASRSLLKNLAYLRRRTARELGELHSERLELSAGNADTVLARVAAVESASWVVGERADAKFVGPHNQTFWRTLATAPGRGWRPVVWLLRAGQQDLAFSAHLEFGGDIWIVANSYVQQHAGLSPGSLLTEDVLAEALARGVRLIDWGQGDSGYKGRWGAQPVATLHDHLGIAPGLTRRLFDLFAARRLKDWTRL